MTTAFAWRTLVKIRHLPEQMLDVTVYPVVFTLMFTFVFGGAISGSVNEYVQFFLPGLIVQTVLFVTVYTGVGINTDIERGVLDRFRSMPIWQPAILIGAFVGDAFRYSAVPVIIVLVGQILGLRLEGGLGGFFLSVALLLCFAFGVSWIWVSLGLLVRTPAGVMSICMFVLLPLTFVSNIFVEPSTMPIWLAHIVAYNPITWLTSAVRGALHGTFVWPEIGLVLTSSIALSIGFGLVSMWLFRARWSAA